MEMFDNEIASASSETTAFTPVHGVTLDRYAEVIAALDHLEPPADVREIWLEAHGIPAGRWDQVDDEWRRRMAAHATVRNRFEVLVHRL